MAYKWYDHLFSISLGAVAGLLILVVLYSNLNLGVKCLLVPAILFVTGLLDKRLDNQLKVKVIGKGI